MLTKRDIIERDLAQIINYHNIDGICQTPDYILAKLLADVLVAISDRAGWVMPKLNPNP